MKEFRRRMAMLIAIAMTLVYLSYRGIYTLNLSGPYSSIASLSLYIAECYGAFLLFLYFFQIWEITNPAPVKPLSNRTVDVYIPTYNEDPDLLRGTISAALRIRYPHKTYVLDDGKRPEVKKLCEELGATYIDRPTNIHAKAGNLNHALEMTDGEFLVIFDADHVSEPHFIDRLIGYFADERLGFVQTPHAFYNFDAYQGVLNYKKGKYWEEGMLFYNVTQPGKNRWNGVTFCGSAAMFRREALLAVNGVATESITEDMHTGLRMHSKGWKSLFVNERLISAQAATDITSFNTQRLRWGEGNLGIMAFDNPITMKGLTFAQRLCYLGSMLSWTTGVQKLFIYAAPLLMLLTGVPPVVNLGWTLMAITFLYLVGMWVGVKTASNGYANLVATELTQMACFWTQVKSTWRAVFRRKKARFVVTSKRGRQSNRLIGHIAPQFCYILFGILAITWATTRYALHLDNDPLGLSIGTALVLVHSWFAWVVIRRAFRPRESRYSWRHPVALSVSYQVNNGSDPISGLGITCDLNERGLGLVTYEELDPTAEVTLTVSAAEKTVTCPAEIRWGKPLLKLESHRDGAIRSYQYGLQFQGLAKEQLDTIWWMGAQYGVALQYEKFQGGLFGVDQATIPRVPICRGERHLQLPVVVCFDGIEHSFATDQIGPESLVGYLPKRYEPGTLAEVELSSPFGPIRAQVKVQDVELREIAGEAALETRLSFEQFFGESRGRLTSALMYGKMASMRKAMQLKPGTRPLPLSQPAAILGTASCAVAAAVVACAFFLLQDDAAIASLHEGNARPDSIALAEELVSRLHQDELVDEQKLLRLRAAMVSVKRDEKVREIDRLLAEYPAKSLNARLLRTASLQNLNRQHEAEPIFVDLLGELDKFPDAEVQKGFLLAAARNSANLENLVEAKRRFGLLWAIDPNAKEGRVEYAGILVRLGETATAMSLLESVEETTEGRHLLAQIHLSQSRFTEAVNAYKQIIDDNPSDEAAKLGLADSYLWGGDYINAAAIYREIQGSKSDNPSVREKLAQCLLWDRQYESVLEVYRELIDHSPLDSKYWDEYLIAASNVGDLPLNDSSRVRSIYENRGQRAGDDEFLQNLLEAMKFGSNQLLQINLMEEILAINPDHANIRLRLADSLYAIGNYEGAENNFRLLLNKQSERLELVNIQRDGM